MPSFSDLKGSAINFKNSSADKLQSTKSRFQSKSSATSTYDPRVSGSKAPPPPSRLSEADEEHDHHDHPSHGLAPHIPPSNLPAGPPPVIPRHTKPIAEGDDENRSPSNPVIELDGHQISSSSSQFRWSRISDDEKTRMFSWLDEYFRVNHRTSAPDL